MKRIVPILLGLSLFALPEASSAATNEFAQSGRFGLGVGSGRITNGLSAKYFLTDSMALQGVVGSWGGWGGWGGIGLSADVLFEMPSLFSNQDLGLNWNAGAGASAGLGTITTLGVSGVAGLSLQIKPFPLEFVAELRPTLLFGNNFTGNLFYFGGGGHIRYFF